MSFSIAELRSLSDEVLIARHDELAKDTKAGIAYYLEELARRDNDRATQQMTKLTRDMHRMTVAITVMTAISVVATLVSLYQTFRPR